MINPQAHLVDTLFDPMIEQKPTRNGFGMGLVEAGKRNEQVVVLCADLAESTRVEEFRTNFPDRYIEIGVAEQNLATVASGLANYGKIPFITSYASFSPGRNNEQIRTTIALNDVPVKIAGSHAGLSVGPDGATHQALEDIGLMRMLPNMTVIVPADMHEAHKATLAAANYPHPVYIRLGRANSPVFTTPETPFEIGKALVLYDTQSEEESVYDCIIFACGVVTHHALVAAERAHREAGKSLAVINIPTIKPLDRATVLSFAKRAKKILTAEEHQVAGGFGSAIAEYLATACPKPIIFIGVHDRFGQTGTPDELFKEYGLDTDTIFEKIIEV
jgi:transketolase